MTTKKTTTFVCPKCKKEFNHEVFDVIDANETSHLYYELMSETAFEVSCPHCHNRTKASDEFHYVNHEKKFSVHFVLSEIAQKELCASFNPKDGYKHRVVHTNLDQALEKISLFEKNYDDRVIEVAKYFKTANFMNLLQITDGEKIQVTIFFEEEKIKLAYYYEGAVRVATLDQSFLDEIEENIKWHNENDEDYIVDSRYPKIVLYAKKEYIPIHKQINK